MVPQGAPMQVNLSCAQRTRLETEFSSNTPKPISSFDEAIAEVFRTMETGPFQRFSCTDAYSHFAFGESA